jgi:hypothetical protein
MSIDWSPSFGECENLRAYISVALPACDAPHRTPGHPEVRGDACVCPMNVRPNEANLLLRQRRALVLRPARITTLLHHISDVLLMRAKPQMVRVYALPNIAAMADEKIRGNRTVMENPRSPVCVVRAPVDGERTVTRRGHTSAPKPAAANWLNGVFLSEPLQSGVRNRAGICDAISVVMHRTKALGEQALIAARHCAWFEGRSHSAFSEARWSGLGFPFAADCPGRSNIALASHQGLGRVG